jgi:hypothetical protein
MALPVIADTFQVRLNWHNANAPRDAANNLYFFDSVGGQTPTNLNTDINAAVTQAMWGVISSDASVNSLLITDLSGSDAGVAFSQAAAAKWTGGGASECVLQASAVVSIKSLFRGPAGRGRVYLPWVAEASQANGALVGSGYTSMQAAWNAFQTAMAVSGWLTMQVSQSHGVDVARDASYVVRPYVFTQRRRARR